jgi:hypothetical protein
MHAERNWIVYGHPSFYTPEQRYSTAAIYTLFSTLTISSRQLTLTTYNCPRKSAQAFRTKTTTYMSHDSYNSKNWANSLGPFV